MPPIVAAVACALLILILFLLNQDRREQVSPALWIAGIWLSLSASRSVSLWLGLEAEADQVVYAEGNPLDARIYAGLLAAGLVVAVARERRVRTLLRENAPLVVFLAYCLASVLWSDHSTIAFKRWIKALGDLVMVLIVLTDPQPTAALKRLLARTGFVLIPLSILLIRYYPSMGRGYSDWTGEAYNTGVATQKNGLGYVCLIFGLGSLWYLLEAYRARGRHRPVAPLIAHGAVLAMAFWLFRLGNSATSFACFLIGGGLLAIIGRRTFARRPAVVHVIVGLVLFVVVYGLFLNPAAGLVEAVGRDATLTGRTEIWNIVLDMTVNPWLGAGYESFWLGERLEKIWQTHPDRPNQAHNGYLQVYLDLGLIGMALLALVMAWGYRGVVRGLRFDPEAARIKLAFFVVAATYNLTEHAFRELHPVWIAFLLAVTVVPEPSAREGA